MQPAVTNTQVSYTVPDDVAVNAVPRSSLPAIFIGERLIVYGILHQSSQSVNKQEGTICLTGDLLGANVEHIMKFQVPPAVTKENMLQVSTVHHLAARKLIKEMEDDIGRGGNNPEIIQLSCNSNVISSQTAFIAIDEERKEAVKGSLESWDILPSDEENIGCLLLPPICASVAYGSDEDMYSSFCTELSIDVPTVTYEACYSSPQVCMYDPTIEDWSDDGDRDCYRAGYIQPEVNLKSAKKAKKKSGFLSKISALKKSKSAKSAPMPADGSVQSSNMPERKSLPNDLPHSSSTSRASTPLSIIINLQLASGAWRLTSELADVIEKTKAEIKDACPVSCQGEMETTWATILVLCYLQLRQSHFKDEWELVAMKAEAWLTKQSFSKECPLHVLRQKADEFLS